MPVRCGLTLHQQLMDLEESTPVIFVSGHATDAMAQQALKNGAFQFFMKPYSDEALLRSVAEACERSARQRIRL